MRHPSLTLTVVPSKSDPGTVSLRLNDADRDGFAIRTALHSAGFLPGDRVILTLEGDQVLALMAKSFFRELRDGVAAVDPVAFVTRWKSVVAEVDAR